MQYETRIGRDLAKAAQLLQEGEVVAIPTETVYGLAGNALDGKAVARIFAVKDRPFFDPLIVHVDSLEAALRYTADWPPVLRRLAERFWPGPLTLLLPRLPVIPDLVTAGLPNVALRMPDHQPTLQLLEMLPFPLAAPSANPFGYISPTDSWHVFHQLRGRIPYILDGGLCHVGVESTIVGFDDEAVTIFRLGGYTVEDIEAEIGAVRIRLNESSNPAAPGMLKSHYAPRTPLKLGKPVDLMAQYPGKRLGALLFQSAEGLPSEMEHIILSPSGDLAQAAQQLFAAMRTLDSLPLDLILAEPVPDEGLGRAINDRLRRAAG